MRQFGRSWGRWVMRSKPSISKLSDIAAINPRRKVKKGSPVPFIEMAALPLSGRDVDSTAITTRLAKSAGSHFQNGDTLLARITPCLENGKTAQVRGLNEGVVGEGSTEFIVLSGHDPEDNDYIYYLCRSTEFRDFAIARMEGTSGRQRVAWQPIAGYQFEFPSPELRRSAATVLATLDDRIDNLRQTNATLEAIAQALFKSWFVDFDPVRAKAEGREPEGMDAATAALFPSEFEDSELGPIPRGWRVGASDDLLAIVGGGTPKTSVDEYWSGDIPWFSVVDTPAAGQVFILDTAKKITDLGLQNCSAKLLPPMTTIISARGTVGKVAMTAVPMAMNQSCYALRPKIEGGEAFIYCSTLRFVEQLQRIAHGAVFDTITRDSFKRIMTSLPPDQAIVAFGALVQPVMERIRANGLQAAYLAEIRDTLLPRLISGKLRLPGAQREVEAALA